MIASSSSTERPRHTVEVIHRPDDAIGEQVRAFLQRCPTPADPQALAGSGEHDPRWLDVLRRSMGHDPYLLIAWDATANGWMCGFMPLALVRSRLFGRFLVSLPYLNRAGVVADDDVAAAALVSQAVALADELGVQYLELRHQRQPIHHPALSHTRDDKFRMVLELPDTASADDAASAIWKALPSKVRNQVRKGEQHNLAIRFGGRELLDDFYRVFAVNMRDLGTPVYPRRLFASILKTFEAAELAVVSCDGQAIAGALLTHHRAAPEPATTAVPSASCLRTFNHTNANMWMYHRLLLRAHQRGSRLFDFGRSSEDSGTYRFKKQWGAKPQATIWQYYVREGRIGQLRPDNPAYRRRIALWRKLPVWVTKIVGPHIVSGIP